MNVWSLRAKQRRFSLLLVSRKEKEKLSASIWGKKTSKREIESSLRNLVGMWSKQTRIYILVVTIVGEGGVEPPFL